MIVKTKYLPDSDLVRLQSICAISQDIAYICNKVIRPAEPDERKKIKERIRDIMVLTVLTNKHNRFLQLFCTS